MNNDKKFLDKSFEDLLKDPSLNKKDLALDKQDKSAVIYLKVSKIKRNPFQTEKIYSESKIDLLAKSIKENGVVNPIRVRFVNNEYQIDPSAFSSKGRSTPFENKKVFGKCMATISNGNVAYLDESLLKI